MREGRGEEAESEDAWRTEWDSASSPPPKQGGSDHSQQRCLGQASQFCGGVNSLLREKERGEKRLREKKCKIVPCGEGRGVFDASESGRWRVLQSS